MITASSLSRMSSILRQYLRMNIKHFNSLILVQGCLLLCGFEALVPISIFRNTEQVTGNLTNINIIICTEWCYSASYTL